MSQTANDDQPSIAEFADELASSGDESNTEGAKAAFSQQIAHGGELAGPNVGLVFGLPVVMKVVLGGARMPVSALASLERGQIVKLDRKVGDKVDIVVNGRTIAQGDLTLIDDGTSRFGVRITNIIGAGGRYETS